MTTDCFYETLEACDMAVVASGTATLETAVMLKPMVIIYKLNWLTYWLGKLLVDIKMIGLVNIVAGEELVPELIQGEVTADNITVESIKILNDSECCQAMQKKMLEIKQTLGEPGVMRRVAQSIFDRLQN